MTDDESSDYLWLALEGKKLAAECEFGQSTLIAAAVICLDRIHDRLEDIASRLGDIDYELKIRRSSTFARSQDAND
jgi:hypothetical protein